ncbi:MAG: hypothetical protein CVU20_08945 [Betaproteobacteria bacterium HGW-Betaproteobacteria-14]|nr:MAG: hypothetical protein CVU20_08945 [Betaproteobacteria bacterium HGW-Betaproteobacteria-14]
MLDGRFASLMQKTRDEVAQRGMLTIQLLLVALDVNEHPLQGVLHRLHHNEVPVVRRFGLGCIVTDCG